MTELNKFGEGFIIPDFERYDKTLQGTYMLYCSGPFYKDSSDNLSITERKKIARFMIGCLIYHQLLYKSCLISVFEL